MRKLFLLIPAMLLTMGLSATTYEIGSGTSNILGTTVASANDGDVIILTDNGPYVNVWKDEGKGDDYTKLEKDLTIKAAEGKTPVIKYTVPFRSRYGKTVKFIGIKFDGSEMSHYDYYFLFYDDNNNNLEFDNCEFTGMSKALLYVYDGKKANSLKLTNCRLHDNSNRGILNKGTLTNLEINGGQIYNFTGYPVLDNYDGATLGKVKINGTEFYSNAKDIISGTATSHADSCIINNCYFHNNSRSAVYFTASTVSGVETCDGVIVKNSTFANNDLSASSRSVIEVQNYGGTAAANIEVTVDHCTFYNNTTVNYDYSCIRSRKSTKVNITNSIFAYPSAIDFYATNCYGGTISNTIVYNLSKGHRTENGAPALTNTTTVTPHFNDLANNNYTYDANWSTGSISPAWKSASDGTSLGDPRWYRDNEVIPSSSITSSYDLLSTKAQLTGDVNLNASDHIKYKGTATPGTAKWKLHVDRACMISAVVDVETGNESGCQLTLTVKDAEGNNVGALAMTSAIYNDDDINLPGKITFSEAGDYTFILTNSTSNSSTALEKITLSYFGGAVQTLATDANTTLNVADAWYNTGGSRADGKITYSSWNSEDSWVKWNATLSESKFFDVTLRISTDNAHHCALAVYEDESASPVATVQESYTEEDEEVTRDIALGRLSLTKDKQYVLKVTNPVSGSRVKIVSLTFAPVVATATELPGTLAFSNAVLSEKANITDGMLYFNEPDADKDPRGEWAQWEVTTNHDGLFLFTMGVTSTNEQSYKITILDNLDNVLDYYESSPGSGDKTLTHYFALNTGSYFVKVENTRSFSKGHLTSLVVTEPAGVVTLDETATDNTSWADKVVAKEEEGPLYDVRIIRTIKAGMYNTICLPFEVSTSQCREIFGADVQLRTLGTATLEEGDFVLNLNFDVANDIYPGTPLLIKTSRDIVNPVFASVKFTTETPGSTTRTNAKFKGNFVAGTIPASENNLFLGANNTLYFPTVDMEILGMRAYFEVIAPAGAVKRARIIEHEQIITDVELVAEQPNAKSQKILRDGQLIIIRDGIRYNVMGNKIQ